MPVSLWSYRDHVALLAAVLAPLATAAVLVPFRTSVANTDAALVLVVVIVAVAANGHRLAGLLAAASAAVWFDFFLTRPYEHFTITSRDDIETTVLLLLVGAAVTELAVRGRRQQRIAVTDEIYLAAIGEITDLVASRQPTRTVVDRVTDRLVELLGLRGCRFERFTFGGLPAWNPAANCASTTGTGTSTSMACRTSASNYSPVPAAPPTDVSSSNHNPARSRR